jgi:hypothetical protein
MYKVMVAALEKDCEQDPSRRTRKIQTSDTLKELCLFVSKHTNKFFMAMKVNQNLFELDPSTWESNEQYFNSQ